jgi:hypothetical protein
VCLDGECRTSPAQLWQKQLAVSRNSYYEGSDSDAYWSLIPLAGSTYDQSSVDAILTG